MADIEKEKVILPEKYYHTYFVDLIAFVEKHSGHLLGREDHEFIKSFRSLSENGQCLWIRFSNRKGPYFRIDRISYAEINTKKAVNELLTRGFVTASLFTDSMVLKLFTKAELLEMFEEDAKLKPLKKDDLLEYLSTTNFPEKIKERFQVIKVEKQDEIEFLKMLYFGHIHGQMTEFVVRDVGHVTLENLDPARFKPWFETREEALSLFRISKLASLIRSALKVISGKEVADALKGIDFSLFIDSRKSQKVIDRIFLELGLQLERENHHEDALFFYRYVRKPPARERQIRIFDQTGDLESAENLANEILEDYRNAGELLFAKDFLNRPKVRINRSTTLKIKNAREIELEEDENRNVEALALDHFVQQGYDGIHCENFLWRNLFGLTFWEELFDQSYESFHNPIQRISSDLFDPDFYKKRKTILKKKGDRLSEPDLLLLKVMDTYSEKKGLSNPMVYWFDEMPLVLEKAIKLLPTPALMKILLEMAKNLKDNSTGFPDLFLWKDSTYQFYEVKSPNDHLSSQQLFWLDFMEEVAINAEILRVKF